MSTIVLAGTTATPAATRGVATVGGVGDNTADDSAAFAAAYTEAATTTTSFPVLGSNRRGNRVVAIPAGTFLVTTPGALMSDLGIPRSRGLVIRGAGRDVTNIVFTPGSANQYLLDNEDDWLHVTFEDITFNSTVSTSSFMKSVSSGGAQNYVFNRVNWTGTWKYGIELSGTNNNSEFTWFHCGIYNNWTAFLYSPSPSSGGTDQFLNYNFIACQNEANTGHFIDMASGGNINVRGGSLIHLGDATSTTSSAQTFFALRGGDHSRGAQRLFVEGVRVEHKHNASQLIYCEWKRGNVTFLSCDTDTQSTLMTSAATTVTADFGATGNTMPIIGFENCTLMGLHRYQYDLNSHTYRKLVAYRNCEITNFPTAAQFITYTPNANVSGNAGSQPLVRFENCRGNGDATELFDCQLGWQTARLGEPCRRFVAMKTAQGNTPASGGTVTFKLPLGSVITKVRGWKPSGDGSSTSTNFAYTLTNADATVIATIAGTGAVTWANGFDYASGDLTVRVTTDNQRTLTLTSSNITQPSTLAVLTLEYLA